MTLIASAFSGSLSVFMFMYIWQVSLILSRCSLSYLLTLWALAGNKITCHLHRVGRKFNPVTRTHTAYCCLDAAAVQVRIPVSLFCISLVYLTTVVVKDSVIHPVGAVSHLASDKPSDSDSDSIIFNCLIKASLHKHLHLFLVFSLNHPLISEYLPLSMSEFPQHLNMAALWNVTQLQITRASSSKPSSIGVVCLVSAASLTCQYSSFYCIHKRSVKAKPVAARRQTVWTDQRPGWECHACLRVELEQCHLYLNIILWENGGKLMENPNYRGFILWGAGVSSLNSKWSLD